MSISLNQVESKYGHKVRLRVCGILIIEDKILMVKHEPLGALGYLWSPPGGVVDYGDNMVKNLKREFFEETGLKVEIGELLFVNEYIVSPIHAVEIFFYVRSFSGKIIKGIDPELPADQQMIKSVSLLTFEEIKSMNPLAVHNAFRHCKSLEDLANLRGYFNFEKYSTI